MCGQRRRRARNPCHAAAYVDAKTPLALHSEDNGQLAGPREAQILEREIIIDLKQICRAVTYLCTTFPSFRVYITGILGSFVSQGPPTSANLSISDGVSDFEPLMGRENASGTGSCSPGMATAGIQGDFPVHETSPCPYCADVHVNIDRDQSKEHIQGFGDGALEGALDLGFETVLTIGCPSRI